MDQVQWLLGENYTSLNDQQRPLECVQEPGDVVYLPDGWLHATVSLGPTVVRYLRNTVHMIQPSQACFGI